MSCHKFTISDVREKNPMFWPDNGKGRSQRYAEKVDKVCSLSKVTQEKIYFLWITSLPNNNIKLPKIQKQHNVQVPWEKKTRPHRVWLHSVCGGLCELQGSLIGRWQIQAPQLEFWCFDSGAVGYFFQCTRNESHVFLLFSETLRQEAGMTWKLDYPTSFSLWIL